MRADRKKATGYDNYINWKIFVFPFSLLIFMLFMPPLPGMKDVGTEYTLGGNVVKEHLAQQLFGEPFYELEQWQVLAVAMIEKSTQLGLSNRDWLLERDLKWCRSKGISAEPINLLRVLRFVSGMEDETYRELLVSSAEIRHEQLSYEELPEQEKKIADQGIWKLKVALAMMVFTVFCFLTACIPLPAVAFFIGLLLVFTGVVGREEVASLYWNDACWFIMGSLMFAAAFIKTGVDKRICLFLFSKFAKPNIRSVTLVLILVISPLAAFISDHALAAIFLPIAMILYRGNQAQGKSLDLELGKMLVITVAMACNIGGFGAPSGGARNVIMINYLDDMFNMDIGYFTWMIYAMPFVIIMMPITWLVLQWRFKPVTRDLSTAMSYLEEDIAHMGKWNRQQILTLIIFLLMVWLFFTEKSFYDLGIYPVRLGIGVVAVAGAMAYILTGVVNWRDYQEKVDWGVVWLYAGAIIFGKVLDDTGAAYYLARSTIDAMSPLHFDHGTPLLAVASMLTAGLTQIMADGPAAASVGTITLSMGAIAHPGTVILPFMAMVTACASSFAYCLIIGTPPNAIVYASGILGPKDFLRVGIPLWIVANLLLLFLIHFYWVPMGFGDLAGFE